MKPGCSYEMSSLLTNDVKVKEQRTYPRKERNYKMAVMTPAVYGRI